MPFLESRRQSLISNTHDHDLTLELRPAPEPVGHDPDDLEPAVVPPQQEAAPAVALAHVPQLVRPGGADVVPEDEHRGLVGADQSGESVVGDRALTVLHDTDNGKMRRIRMK